MTYNSTPAITVVHPIALLATPAFGGPVRALLGNGDTLKALRSRDGFLDVETSAGQRGFVPAAACTPLAIGKEGGVSDTNVAQAISLYRHPLPGTQFADSPEHDPSFLIILPEDRLWLLGRDGDFALVQCADGRLGYVPASVCGLDYDPEALIPLGRIDAGWIGLGCAMFACNSLALRSMLQRVESILPFPSFYLEAPIVLVVVAALWWFSPRRFPARSFALGIVIAYTLIFVFFIY